MKDDTVQTLQGKRAEIFPVELAKLLDDPGFLPIRVCVRPPDVYGRRSDHI